MEKRDLLIIEYLSKGFKTTEISQKLMIEHSIKVSKSLIEKKTKSIKNKVSGKNAFPISSHSKKRKHHLILRY